MTEQTPGWRSDAVYGDYEPQYPDAPRTEAPDPATVHVNDGSAHDRAMAWSEGYSEGYAHRGTLATELLDAVEAALDPSLTRHADRRARAMKRLREAYNAVVKETNR